MTELIQHKYPSFSTVISKMDTAKINFNIDLITRDISKFENAVKNAKSYNKSNIKALSEYLRKLVRCLDENLELELAWSIDSKTELPKSYPISLVCEDAYGINTCNYIEIEPGVKLVDIDTTELANIISFEFVYRDLGDTHSSIENLLKDCGVTGVESSDILTEHIKKVHPNSSLFELSKTLKIGDSPYRIKDSGSIQDYFGVTTFKDKSYRDVIKYSCEYANAVIMCNICKEANKHKINFKMLSLDSTRIQFMIKDFPDDYIRDTLIGDIIVRVFGRRFKINNKINIY